MKENTWVVVVHRAGARFFKLSGAKYKLRLLEELENPDGKLKTQEINSDRPGRYSASRTNSPRSMMRDPREHIVDRFVKDVSTRLRHHADDFEELIMIAEPRLMGKLRGRLTKNIASKMRVGLLKDFAHLSDRDVLEHLRERELVI